MLTELFRTFFEIGLFTFGGGYGMIPLVQQAALNHGWMDADELYRFIGVCESTPGPIAVNMATFVGSRQAGLAGAALATLGVVLPALVIMMIIAFAARSFESSRHVKAAMSGVKPVVAGMIVAAGACALVRCLAGSAGEYVAVDVRQALVFAVLGAGLWLWRRVLKRPFSPIALILFSAFFGAVAYGV